MKRKLFYGLLVAVLCCGILTGCGGKTLEKKEDMTLMVKVPVLGINSVSRPDIVDSRTFLEQAGAAFAAQYEKANVTVQVDSFDYVDEIQAIPGCFETPDATEVLYEGYFNMASYIHTGRVVPLDDIISDDLRKDIDDASWAMSMVNGKTYMMPFSSMQNVLAYNKTGRSIVPMLIGFGCTVPAVMSTRTLPSERDRKMTILLTPFMSCTAKLPIYAFFVNAFFPRQGGLIMTGLYLLGILVGILVALIFKKTMFKGEAVPFVMELPNYRMPGVRNVLQLLWEKAKDFLQRAFSVILIATIVVWFLQSFDFHFNMVKDSHDSILAAISGLLVPLFKPLGLGDWRICTALISGFMAKESVVSVLEVLFGSEGGVAAAISSLAAASLLVFSLLYTPCVAAIASIKRELGWKWALYVVLWQCTIAWIAALLVRLIGGIML